MILDGHIHIGKGPEDRADFVQRLQSAGIAGGVVISLPPPSFAETAGAPSVDERLDNLLFWVENQPDLYPFFWIDPLEDAAIEQVQQAVERGVVGFKVICSSFFAGDARALRVFRAISQAKKPILFHSGILWDGRPSAPYNQPAQFEALLEVEGLRFALAHISWPWCDELIAVYGKFLNAYARRPDFSVEMFIDLTPGTPPIYRAEVLTKLLTVGYDVGRNIIFGTDCHTNDYNGAWTQEWIRRDREIYQSLGLSEDGIEQIFSENLRQFIAPSAETIERKIPRAAES